MSGTLDTERAMWTRLWPDSEPSRFNGRQRMAALPEYWRLVVALDGCLRRFAREEVS